MPLPSMPSLTDLPQKELRTFDVALKIFGDNFGKIHSPNGDGNCGYYVLFKAFKFLGKNLMEKSVGCAGTQEVLEQRKLSYSSLDWEK